MSNSKYLWLPVVLVIGYTITAFVYHKKETPNTNTSIIKFDNNNDVKWENPFPKGKLGEAYNIQSQDNHKDADKLFDIKSNSIEVLYNWPDGKAPFAILTSTKTYSHFNFEFKYKWGTRKFAPRDKEKRDAGFLFHGHGEKIVWPTSLECQVQENDTGDLWVIKGPKVNIKNPDGSIKTLDTSGENKYQRQIKSNNYETTGWNDVRVEVRGNTSARFFVNGHLVNELTDFVTQSGKPLNKGFICLQAEGAELIYKNVRIQNLKP